MDNLRDFWTKLAERKKSIVESWSFGMIYGFFYESSLYDGDRLFQFISDYFSDHDPKRHINLGIANILTG